MQNHLGPHFGEEPEEPSFRGRAGKILNGGESFTSYEPRQLVDTFEFSFQPVGENAEELRRLRLDKKLSLRQLAKKTGHSISYLQQQLRKFGIDKAKGNVGIAPYGWDWGSANFSVSNGTYLMN